MTVDEVLEEIMDYTTVKKAKDKMLKTIEIANTVSTVCLVSFLAIVAYIMLNKNIDTKDGIILLLAVSIIQLNVVHIMGYWKQRAIFNVSIALLKWIDINYPKLEMPPIQDEK
jgi:hypothetical protein